VKWNARRKIARWARRTEGAERVIICYALSPTLSDATLSAARKHGIKCAALVTDIPQLMNVAQNQGGIKARLYTMYSKSTYEKMTQYDMYILLTDAMSDVVNPKQKPYVVVEGMTDSAMAHMPNDIAGKHSPKVVLYAGALFEKYGVRNLVEGFLEADIPGCELWLFGNGEMEGWLNSLNNDNVKYLGVVPNSEVVAHEIAATLLVNPRPSTEEFTKYSFPSKNMEYMMSGTPVLTCRLPGMPDEYLEYVYIARDEDAHGFAQALADIMSKDARELHEMGQHAKRFVSSEKSNICQAQKIAEFISKNL
jgi:glycosyltransferase involved in cell wall biosynthesis